MYRIAKCNAIERVMAYTKIMLFHNGNVSKDSLDDNAFIALEEESLASILKIEKTKTYLNISITTRIDSDIVEAVFAVSS